MRSALAFALMVALAAPAGAKEKAAGAPSGKLICRGGERQLGSHVRRPPVCRTAEEWEMAEQAARTAPIPVKAPQPESWERSRPQ
jgi:hypothetical protein